VRKSEEEWEKNLWRRRKSRERRVRDGVYKGRIRSQDPLVGRKEEGWMEGVE
jgi:hypothetical protein